jgi:DNA invertase Pin-like site-specific DNA recombinase
MSDHLQAQPHSSDRLPNAVEYVRMSTEHQQYSTENQQTAIRKYAAQHGMTITRTYGDVGKSGLRLSGRGALQQLLAEVQSGKADFGVILVYDVSRWGRFQDADESAYYEYICKRHDIQVHYCAEAFTNDNTPTATIIKSVKRAMAGEYSRELSVKVFAGQCRLIELGYRQGGMAGYGLRRMLLDQHGQHKSILKIGEHKSLQTDRVILVPGPSEEVATVQRIYNLFVHERQNEEAIAELLNLEGIKSDLGRPWTRATIHQVLTNPKYQGDNVYNRVSFKLKQKRVRNPPDMWIRHDRAFTSIIDNDLFAQANEIIQARHQHLSDEELLARLRQLLSERGTLSGLIIDESPGMPSSSAYRSRFQSLVRAYTLIGFDPGRDYAYIAVNRRLIERHQALRSSLIAGIQSAGAGVEDDGRSLRINKEFTLSFIVSRCKTTKADKLRWNINLDLACMPDLTVAVRMQPDNELPLDYYILPSIDMRLARLRLRAENAITMDVYRFEDLTYFYGLVRRRRLLEVA